MNRLYPGKIIGVRARDVTHEGIVTSRNHKGEWMVISNSSRAGGVYEEPLSVFLNGKEILPVAQLSAPSAHFVITRARAMIGTRYRPFKWNCEQFVRYAYGHKPESPTLQGFAKVGIALLFLSAVTK